MSRILTFTYGTIAYGLFLAAILYAIGFVSGIYVPKTVDSGPAPGLIEALVVNLLLLTLFAVQHSGMARQPFKQWLMRFLSPALERSTFVLLSSLGAVSAVLAMAPDADGGMGRSSADLRYGSVGDLSFGLGSGLCQYLYDQPLRTVWASPSRKLSPPSRHAADSIQDARTLQGRAAPNLPWLYHSVLGHSPHDGGSPPICLCDYWLHSARHHAGRARSDGAIRRCVPGISSACCHAVSVIQKTSWVFKGYR